MEPLPLPGGQPAAPAPRLFDPAAPQPTSAGGLLTDQNTLSQAWFDGLRPLRVPVRKPRTIQEYDQSIGRWARLTGDPPLALIDDYTLAAFVAALEALPAIESPNTIRKHCTHLQAVLDYCGPRTRSAPKARGLLGFVPVFEKPAELESEADDGYALAEVSTLLTGCHLAVAPLPTAPEHRTLWWESLFLVAWNTFLRAGALMSAEWHNLTLDAGIGWRLKVREKGNRVRRISVNAAALAAIERLRPLTGHTARIFHFPHQMNWLHDNCRRIVAGVLPPERRFGLHALRKGGITELSKTDPLAAQMQAGHTKGSVTKQFYIHPRRVHEALETLPQPERPHRGPQQLDLF